MAKRSGNRKKIKSLSHGRPPNLQKPAASLSSKATRTLIRSFHQLEKARAKAITDGDKDAAAAIETQMEQQGGLKAYQQASITGQMSERGGDSSKVLMEWLRPVKERVCSSTDGKLRMLEVGALSVNNAYSRSGLFEMTRIDLNSQHEHILQQDFMERPIPANDADNFDIISLSLVLNYVPTPEGRGEMLRRSCNFLRSHNSGMIGGNYFPSLFVVLPAPCMTNSRYLDEKRFGNMMNTLAFELVKWKLSAKLAYSLWRYEGTKSSQPFPRLEVNPGSRRNNFTVVLT